jgi:hypothetical protein
MRRQVFDATGVGGTDPPIRSGWRLEIAMKVVEREELEGNRAGRILRQAGSAC